MSLITPATDSRIGIILNEGNVTTSSIIVAVEAENDSPFWSIHFGRKINNGDSSPLDSRGTVVLEENMIRDILTQIDLMREKEKWEEHI